MKKFKKFFTVISVVIMLVSFSAGIYNVSAFSMNDFDFSDCKTIEAGTIQVRKGGVKNIPNSLEAYEIMIEDESVAGLEPTEIGPSYRVIGLKNGTTKLSIVPFGNSENPEKYVYTVEVSDKFSKDLKLSDSEISISDGKHLHLIDPYDDYWWNVIESKGIYDNIAKWTSDNESVVTVMNGNLFPKASGTATVTALLNNTEYKCIVTVIKAPLKEDFSGDGTVDFLDLVKLSKLLLPDAEVTSEQLSLADLNGNGKLDFLDLVALSKELLKNANK